MQTVAKWPRPTPEWMNTLRQMESAYNQVKSSSLDPFIPETAKSATEKLKYAPSPPASAFAALLRRSRFASHDPYISQTYSSPPAYAHRGNWGLKRPIPVKRRGAYVVVRSMDSRYQQTEWNHAEAQVRFIQRWEEMGMEANPQGSSWEKMLGKEGREWTIDSEFSPREEEDEEFLSDEEKNQRRKDAVQAGTSFILPNIYGMNASKFKAFLEKVRKLRPAFKEHLNNHEETANKPLLHLARSANPKWHQRFLVEELAKETARPDSREVQPLPHRTGALLYNHPSPLQTELETKLQPGIVLQKSHSYSHKGTEKSDPIFVSSFAGLSSKLKQAEAGDRKELLDLQSDEGILRANIPQSIALMKLAPNPKLGTAPNVVGFEAQGLKAVKLDTKVTIPSIKFTHDNPYTPGSAEYVACKPFSKDEKHDVAAPVAPKVRTARLQARIMDNLQGTEDTNAEILGKLQFILKASSQSEPSEAPPEL